MSCTLMDPQSVSHSHPHCACQYAAVGMQPHLQDVARCEAGMLQSLPGHQDVKIPALQRTC